MQVRLARWIARSPSHTRLGLEEPRLPWSQTCFTCRAATPRAPGSCLAALPAAASCLPFLLSGMQAA